jgi:hypothetical protein
MSYLVASGSVVLNGKNLVQLQVPQIDHRFIRVVRGVSGPMEGTIVFNEIISGSGFGISSTSEKDIGQIVHIQVYDETTMKLRPNYEDEIEKEIEEFMAKRKARK